MRPALLLLAVAACASDPLTIEEMSCPETGTTLTYDNFGEAFFATHCNTCHASSTAGAPRAFKFDTVDQIRDHAARIFIRSAGPNVTMPPGPVDPPDAERDMLAEWLACGAP